MHRMPTSLMRLLDQGNIAKNKKEKGNKEDNARYYKAENLTLKECLTL